MPRPQKHNADYFPHDNSMRNDRKIKAVMTRFGLTGYAVYCMLLEVLTAANLLRIEWDDLEIEMLSGDFQIETNLLKEIVEYFCKIDLVQIENGFLFCCKLDQRLAPVFKKRKADIESLRSGNGVSATETPLLFPKPGFPSRESKVKERKEKKREPGGARTPSPRSFKISTDFEVTSKMKEWAKKQGINGSLTSETEKFIDYYKGNGKLQKDWPATWRNWMRRAVDFNPSVKNDDDGLY